MSKAREIGDLGDIVTVTDSKLLIGTTASDAVGAEAGSITISTGDSGVTTPQAVADDLVIENDTNGGISILNVNTGSGNICFGDPDDADVGKINYSHTNNQFTFTTNGSTGLAIQNDGMLTVVNVTDYETLVTLDDDIPNKKFCDDTYLKLAGGTLTGNLTVSKTSPIIEIDGSASSNAVLQFRGADNTADAFLYYADATDTFLLQARTSNGTNIAAGLQMTQSGVITVQSGGNDTTSATERMRLNANGELQIGATGDLGDYKLQVTGNQVVTGILDVEGSGSGIVMNMDNTSGNNGGSTKQIVLNDGAANWALRQGVYYSSGYKHHNATDGGSHIILSGESANGSITLLTQIANAGATGAAAVEQSRLTVGTTTQFHIGSGATLIGEFTSTGLHMKNAAPIHVGTTATQWNTVSSDGGSIMGNGDFAFARNGTITGVFNRSDNNTTNLEVFRINRKGVKVGACNASSTLTTWATTSDYRLKENIHPLPNGVDRVMLLKPSRFNFKENPEQRIDGFIAHEVAEIVPEAVQGEKDAVDENGDIDPQTMDAAKLIPIMVAAIQELKQEIEELKNGRTN